MSCQQLPIYVISLLNAQDPELRAKSQQRWRNISGQLDAMGLNYERFDGVEGSRLSSEMIQKLHVDPDGHIAICGHALSPGEIGVALAHLKLYQHILDAGHEAVCIIEDDAQLDSDFPAMCSRAMLQHPWDVALLAHRSSHRHCEYRGGVTALFDSRRTFPGRALAKPAELPFLTLAYLIRRHAADTLLRYAAPICMASDHLLSSSELLGLDLRLCSPPCARHDKNYKLDTTAIGRQEIRAAKRNVLTPKQQVLTFIRKRLQLRPRLLWRRLGINRLSYLDKWGLRSYWAAREALPENEFSSWQDALRKT